jgi:hypothetical protein
MPAPEALTECLRRFMQEAEILLRDHPAANPLRMAEVETWQRGADGYFRRVITTSPGLVLYGEKIWDGVQSLAYRLGVWQALLNPPIAGLQEGKGLREGKSIGVEHVTSTIDVDTILLSLIRAAVRPEESFSFDMARFEVEWSQIWETLSSDTVPYVLIAPLRGFSASKLPIELARDLVIDKFTNDEVRRCLTYDVIRPGLRSFGHSAPDEALGIRWSGSAPKVVEDLAYPPEPKRIDPGVFGGRQPVSGHRLVDDVLTVLRLLKAGPVWSPGSIVSFRKWIPHAVTQFRPGLSFRPGRYELNEREIVELQKLWQALSELLKAKQFPFLEVGLRRFNFAFDRFESEDRIVDLLIAAESLFLKDKRDELTFRLAVLASKFVKNTAYTERQLYNTMIDAYGVRSDIVHGTKVRKTRLLDRNVPLSAFTDAVEEIMRCALRKATDLAHKGVKFDKDFWEALLFGENTAVAHLVVGAS